MSDKAVGTDHLTRIKIETPLPMGVAGALLQLLGAAYPEAVIETDDSWGSDRRMVIAVDARKSAKRAEGRRLRKEAEVADDEMPADFLGFDKGWVRVAPPEELCLALGEVAHHIMVASEGAVNYLEWEVFTPEQGPRYVLSVARSKGQTPHKLRLKAEAEVERLQALLTENGIDTTPHPTPAAPGG